MKRTRGSGPSALPLTVTRRKLPEEIAEQLESLILAKQLPTGWALPPERVLAEQLGVSRNVIREALRILERKNLIVVRPGSGAYVVEPTTELLSESLKLLVQFNAQNLFELIEARKALEVEIAGLAAERATPEDLEEIRHWLEEMKRNFETPERYVEADLAFHASLAKAAKNAMLLIMLKSVRAAMRQNIFILASQHPTARQEAMRAHHQIFEAIRERNPSKARETMREHLDQVAQGLQDLQKAGLLT